MSIYLEIFNKQKYVRKVFIVSKKGQSNYIRSPA